MKIFKRIIYSLIGLIMTLTIAMVGIILYSEYSGKRFHLNSPADKDEYAALLSEEESRLVYEQEANAGGSSEAAVGQSPEAQAQETQTPQEAAPAADTAAVPGDAVAAAPEVTPPPAAAPETEAAAAPQTQTESSGAQKVYVLNKESAIFHYSDCALAAQINPDYYGTMTATREDVSNRGYDPCTTCNP